MAGEGMIGMRDGMDDSSLKVSLDVSMHANIMLYVSDVSDIDGDGCERIARVLSDGLIGSTTRGKFAGGMHDLPCELVVTISGSQAREQTGTDPEIYLEDYDVRRDGDRLVVTLLVGMSLSFDDCDVICVTDDDGVLLNDQAFVAFSEPERVLRRVSLCAQACLFAGGLGWHDVSACVCPTDVPYTASLHGTRTKRIYVHDVMDAPIAADAVRASYEFCGEYANRMENAVPVSYSCDVRTEGESVVAREECLAEFEWEDRARAPRVRIAFRPDDRLRQSVLSLMSAQAGR